MPQLRLPAQDLPESPAPPTWLEDAANAAVILLGCAALGAAAYWASAPWSGGRAADDLASTPPVALGALAPHPGK